MRAIPFRTGENSSPAAWCRYCRSLLFIQVTSTRLRNDRYRLGDQLQSSQCVGAYIQSFKSQIIKLALHGIYIYLLYTFVALQNSCGSIKYILIITCVVQWSHASPYKQMSRLVARVIPSLGRSLITCSSRSFHATASNMVIAVS